MSPKLTSSQVPNVSVETGNRQFMGKYIRTWKIRGKQKLCNRNSDRKHKREDARDVAAYKRGWKAAPGVENMRQKIQLQTPSRRIRPVVASVARTGSSLFFQLF